MDDLSLYQWLVLGLLFIISLCALVIAFGLDRSLEQMTQRLERALEQIESTLERRAYEDSPTGNQRS